MTWGYEDFFDGFRRSFCLECTDYFQDGRYEEFRKGNIRVSGNPDNLQWDHLENYMYTLDLST